MELFKVQGSIYVNDNIKTNGENVIGRCKDIKEYLTYCIASRCLDIAETDYECLVYEIKDMAELIEELDNKVDEKEEVIIYEHPMGGLMYELTKEYIGEELY